MLPFYLLLSFAELLKNFAFFFERSSKLSNPPFIVNTLFQKLTKY